MPYTCPIVSKAITGLTLPTADSPFQTTKLYDASVTEPDRGCHCPGRLIIDLLDRDPRLSGYDVSTGPHEFSNPPSRDRHAEESHEVSDGYNGVVQQGALGRYVVSSIPVMLEQLSCRKPKCAE